jgi:Domain of unknown function (DUF222)
MLSNMGCESVGARLGAVTESVGDLVHAVQAGGLRGEGHDELSGLLSAVRSLGARLDFVSLSTVREVDSRGSFVADGALSAGAWARMHTRMTPGEAASVVRTARTLGSGELPGTAAALAAGVIDLGHVKAITAAVADAPVGAALARYARRGLTLSPLPDGAVHLRGLADEVTGAVLATAIDAANPPVSGDTRTPAQQRMDALAEICRRYLGSPDAPMSGGGHAHLIVTLDHITLTNGAGSSHTNSDCDRDSDSEPDTETACSGPAMTAAAGQGYGAGPGGTLSWVGPIPGSTARRVGCDADVTFVGIDANGEATILGREQRFFSWAQRKAMIARDGDRCAVPYCDRPISWADGHHLDDWALGGPTDVTNGALPCAGHHTMCHEGGWTLIRLPDGRYQFRHRDGKTVGPEPYPPGHNRPPPHKRE